MCTKIWSKKRYFTKLTSKRIISTGNPFLVPKYVNNEIWTKNIGVFHFGQCVRKLPIIFANSVVTGYFVKTIDRVLLKGFLSESWVVNGKSGESIIKKSQKLSKITSDWVTNVECKHVREFVRKNKFCLLLTFYCRFKHE